MIPTSESDLLKLQNTIIQNFAILQSDIENFLKTNSKLLQVYLDNVDQEQHLQLATYKNYVCGLFGMLQQTTDFIKEMMLKARSTNFTPKFDDYKRWEAESTDTSEVTLTGQQNGYCYMNGHSSAASSSDSGSWKNYNGLYDCSPKKPKLPYGEVDSSSFMSGCIIEKAHVASINLETLCFHICLSEPHSLEILTKLFNATDREPYQSPPVAGIVFGMRVDEGILRAIRCQPVSTGKVFLLDFGDFVDVNKNLDEIYHLTREEQTLPAQAILCKLAYEEDDVERHRERLNELLYQHTSFRVVENIEGVLLLETVMLRLDQNGMIEEVDYYNSSPPLSSSSYDETGSYIETNQFTPEELQMFNEDPTCTSNALMAVMGCIPQDDHRICRFYDPNIDSCFKGNNCHQQHIPMRADYITKDIVPASVYAAMQPTWYEPNEVLKVTITHITSLEYFYGIVLNPAHPLEPLIWKEKDIPATDYLKRLPFPYDIVLAKFNDGLWYRAQVIEIDESQRQVNVFYMDYGNRQTVHLKNLAKCNPEYAKMPAQAQQFRLADLRSIVNEKEIQLRGMTMLCDMLLNNEVTVIVVSHYEDLVVRFIDSPYSQIPCLLAEMQCVQLIELF